MMLGTSQLEGKRRAAEGECIRECLAAATLLRGSLAALVVEGGGRAVAPHGTASLLRQAADLCALHAAALQRGSALSRRTAQVCMELCTAVVTADATFALPGAQQLCETAARVVRSCSTLLGTMPVQAVAAAAP